MSAETDLHDALQPHFGAKTETVVAALKRYILAQLEEPLASPETEPPIDLTNAKVEGADVPLTAAEFEQL